LKQPELQSEEISPLSAAPVVVVSAEHSKELIEQNVQYFDNCDDFGNDSDDEDEKNNGVADLRRESELIEEQKRLSLTSSSKNTPNRRSLN
jgi:hypothetical protein